MKDSINHAQSTQSAEAQTSESAQGFEPEKHEISVHELKQKRDRNEPIVLLDVREQDEYEIVHFEDALLIPVNELPQQAHRLDRDSEIVIHCHKGMRSMYAAAYLYQLGYRNVKSLTGGIDQWAIEIDSTLNRY
ncbi:MAG: rhodanese-like domain-containing protein [Candidatus Poribacteria bacterium]|nr:rhodanese-like domain-containing protein [Candidatus Poribacteria bacterium]